MREPTRAMGPRLFRRREGQWSILSYYVTILGRILRGQRRFLFVLASAMHAVGHALVALVAGAVAVGLTTGVSSSGAGSLHRFPSGHGVKDAFLLSVVGLAVVFVKALTGVYATYVQGRAAGELGAALRIDLLDALLAVHRLRRPRHDDQGALPVSATARGVAALTERVHEVEQGLKHGLLGGVRAVAQLVPLAIAMVLISPRTALTACLALGVFAAALGRVRSGYRRALTRGASERTRLLEVADESVRHADLWVSYGAEAKARTVLDSLGGRIAVAAARLDARGAALSGANEVLGALALAVAIGASRLESFGTGMSGATLLAFVVAFFLAYRPIRELTEARLALERASAAYHELTPILGSASRTTASARKASSQDMAPGRDRGSGEEWHSGEGHEPAAPRVWSMAPLELRALRLVRGACGPVSARIEPGSIAVIVGPTGVGKTTLLRTLLGFECAAGDEVLYGGVPIGDVPAGPQSRPFAWVPQDAPLLADTLGANIGLGGGTPDVRDALEPLGAAHLAEALDGARLGAGGRAVSGGERQWIALARAVATGQPVLLLDEPTSGLDAGSQLRVLDAIARLRGRRTVLLVTHRAEPLGMADIVVRLDPAPPAREAA